ncbi:MAG: DNA repair protein RecN [Hyphomicrobiales bacterium]|nr:DNA repair protein RecN [Hyphomicrobiales bacterium]
MLATLSIRDIILIDRLDLEFAPGMSAFTGETGAGKSILLDAFALALGARGDAGLVRNGAPFGQVTAQFDLPSTHPALAMLAESGVDASEEFILRRVQTPDGRAKAFINETPVSVLTLRRAGALLVEIHGQHEDRAFVDTAAHRRLLDAYGGLTGDVARVEALWRRWREAIASLDARRAESDAARKSIDYARHAADELQNLDAREGEEETLAANRLRMQHVGKIASTLDDLCGALTSGGIENKLGGALRRLERQPGSADISAPVSAAVERVLIEIAEASALIKSAREGCEFSETELENAEARLFKLREMARKYRSGVADLPALGERFRAECAAVDAAEKDIRRLETEAREAETAFRKAGSALSASRRAAAASLDNAVAKELKPLKLERARFLTQFHETVDGGPAGFETAGFAVQTNPGSSPGPLMKVASGGELSRFILALKVSLAQKGSAPTLVFDEIDQGVGGATASAIGDRLAALAETVQVLAVTHSPQVASHATHHFSISKNAVRVNGAESMVTHAAQLDGAGRIEEIARMLAGVKVTDAARKAAASLMEAGRA